MRKLDGTEATKEDIGLLVADLTIRFNNGVHVKVRTENYDGTYSLYDDVTIYGVYNDNEFSLHDVDGQNAMLSEICEDYVFPYLYPMEMVMENEEIRKEYDGLTEGMTDIFEMAMAIVGWCLNNHVDYRGLIGRGLAENAYGKGIYKKSIFESVDDEVEMFDFGILKPFDKVIVRSHDTMRWSVDFFSYMENLSDSSRFVVSGGMIYEQCIPYNEETESYVGSDMKAEKKYRIWEKKK